MLKFSELSQEDKNRAMGPPNEFIGYTEIYRENSAAAVGTTKKGVDPNRYKDRAHKFTYNGFTDSLNPKDFPDFDFFFQYNKKLESFYNKINNIEKQISNILLTTLLQKKQEIKEKTTSIARYLMYPDDLSEGDNDVKK